MALDFMFTPLCEAVVIAHSWDETLLKQEENSIRKGWKVLGGIRQSGFPGKTGARSLSPLSCLCLIPTLKMRFLLKANEQLLGARFQLLSPVFYHTLILSDLLCSLHVFCLSSTQHSAAALFFHSPASHSSSSSPGCGPVWLRVLRESRVLDQPPPEPQLAFGTKYRERESLGPGDPERKQRVKEIPGHEVDRFR